MAKKKSKKKDPGQKSLISFLGSTPEKESEKEVKGDVKKRATEKKKEETLDKGAIEDKIKTVKDVKKQKKDIIKKEKEGIIESTQEAIIEEAKSIPIPSDMYFQVNDQLFGLKEDNIELEQISRESATSKYIRYLIEKGKIVSNLERGLLLDVDYDGGQNKAYCKFYDLDSGEIKIWIDTTDHEPYCLCKKSVQELENNIELTNFEGFKRFEEIKKVDLLRDKTITMTKIYGKTPLDIGGSGTNIKNILKKQGIETWEADIRYHLNYIYDRNLIPGLIYKIEKGKIIKIDCIEQDKELKKFSEELRDLFANESEELKEFAEKNLEIFLTPIPDVKRLALDIEVNLGEHDYKIPDPRLAKQEIITISFVSNDGLKRVYMLEREGFSYCEKHDSFPEDAKLFFFKSEKDLLIEAFRLIWKYPIIITFNGDNFDLNYIFHRANKLKIDRDLNPIQVKRGFGFLSRAECELRGGIHIDLFNFFFNRSISGYAFGGAYERASLNAISDALLGKEKYVHEEEIHDMTYDVLAWYNLKDSLLTLELTQFNDNLVWNLIVLLCRITKMPIHDLLRHQISSWIQNIFYFEHRHRNFLIPKQSDIGALKKGGYSKSIIEGKGFKGAYVVTPVPGIHYNVVVMDFASLYPSIIKEYNLSYETVLCPHEDCKDNFAKGIPYYICTHKMGIFAYVVGFFRDIRVKYFKPQSGNKKISKEQRAYFNTIQQALKVFINGSYGVFGSKNFPLFCLPVAESTTGIGRFSIKATIKKAESMGIKVLYGDSDSVFLLNPSKKQLEELTKWSKENLDLDLEVEKVYQFLALSERKKNYIGIYKDTKYVDIKGLVAKKKNTPEFIKKVFNELIEILKNITNDDEFAEARKKIIEIVRENMRKIGKPGAFPLEDYAINISLQKNPKDYKKVIPQHVNAALELQKITGKEYHKGDVVSFVKTKGGIGAKALELAKLQDIDAKKYRELLKSALEQVLDALGITFDEIGGIRKMDSFF